MSDPDGWRILDHACRHCFGRLLQSGSRIRCADCGAEVHGPVQDLCVCGATLRQSGRSAGLQCRVNPAPSPRQPSQIVIVYFST